MKIFLLAIFLLSITDLQTSHHNHAGNETEFAEEYLKKFYAFQRTEALQSKVENGKISEIFHQSQQFFIPKDTGKLECNTTRIKNTPRCGFPDVFDLRPETRGWRKHNLTYRTLMYTSDMPSTVVDEAIKMALKVWSNVTPLTFTQVHDGDSDIEILFAEEFHNDFYPFDGPENILGHAFLPGNGIGGDIHFDDGETWSHGQKGYNLFSMAVHLLGHSLGLLHSNNSKSLMFPTYKFISSETFQLPQEDVDSIRLIYDSQVLPKEQELGKFPQCLPNTTFDAVMTMSSEIIFFKNEYMWRQFNKSLSEYLTIEYFFKGVPNNIEAAYEYQSSLSIIIFFKGNQYWNVTDYKLDRDSPKDISQLGFPASVQKIDAAVHDESRRKTYFFVDEQYWSYDEQTQKLDSDYPKEIKDGFPGIGERVDAAYERNGSLFFLHGPIQYRFDRNTKKAEVALDYLPWITCMGNNNNGRN